MKTLEKISLALFSGIILILSIILMLLLFSWLDKGAVTQFINFLKTNNIATNVTMGVCTVFILVSIKNIFFPSDFADSASGDGIRVENENGSVLITRETLENIVNGVVKSFDSAKETYCKIFFDKENNLEIGLTLFVLPDVVIKDLSGNIQEKIKETIKATADLDVKQIDIRIKNIYTKKLEED